MAYRIEAIVMILSDLYGHSLLQALPAVIFSYIYAAVDESSTGIVHL